MAQKVNVKLTPDQLEALVGIYELRVREDIADKLYGLANLHAQDFWQRLRILQLKCGFQSKVSVGMNLIEAKALLDYWEMDDRPLGIYTANVVRMFTEKAGKMLADMKPFVRNCEPV